MKLLLRLVFLLILVSSAVAQLGNAVLSPERRADDIVGRFRKIIVLTDNQESLDPMVRERAEMIAWVLFERNQGALADLHTGSVDGAHEDSSPLMDGFLARVEGVRNIVMRIS